MLLVAGLYTALIVCLNEIAQGGGSNLYEPTLYPSFTPLEIEERVRGSKIVVASEQAMLNVIYAVKASMLVMYTRLTLGLATQRLVRYLACYTLAGYLASQVAFFAACVPFAGYWSVPPVAEQCATLARYSVVQAVFNISSDVAMLSVPLPLVLRTSMPARQKAVLGVIFGMGLFVVTAAVLTKVYNLGDVYSEGYMLWYVREASVAVYVGNAPMVWPLLREWLPVLRGWTPGGSSSRGKGVSGRRAYGEVGSRGEGTKGDGVGGRRMTTTTGTGRRKGNRLGSLDSGCYDLDVVPGGGGGGKYKEGDSESTEQIVGGEREMSREGSRDSIGIAVTKMGGIQVRRTVEVMEERSGQREVSGKGEYVVDVEVAKGGHDWERRRDGARDIERGRL